MKRSKGDGSPEECVSRPLNCGETANGLDWRGLIAETFRVGSQGGFYRSDLIGGIIEEAAPTRLNWKGLLGARAN